MKRAHVVLCVVAIASAVTAQEADVPRWMLREVNVTTRDPYTVEEADDSWFYGFFNALHIATDESLVRREMWFGGGDTVTSEELEELERNLRRAGLFGAVSIEPVETGEPGVADLQIDTRDRFSLIAFARVSSVGGVTTYDTALGEFNFLGTGRRLIGRASQNDDGERSASVSYTEPYLFGTWHRLATTIGRTEEGHSVALDITRPFKHLSDPISYGVNGSSSEDEVDYFAKGKTIAEVSRRRNAVGGFVSHAFGPRDMRGTVGLDVGHDNTDYGMATGIPINVPGNTRRTGLGSSIAVDHAVDYLKLQGIDAIDFVEDVTLGVSGNVRVGMSVREESRVSTEVQPVLSGGVSAAMMPLPETYLTLAGSGSGRWHAGDTKGWRFSGAVHAFNTSLPRQTLAVSVSADAAFEEQDLTPQYTLGEDNGLRGYPAREFGGTRRVRMNVENRIDPGIEFGSIHVGLVVFGDVGWIHGRSQGLSQGQAIKSVGGGLRFGSSEIFGGNVIRLDFGFPLDDVNGTDYGMSVSFSGGQVFSFFGNSSELATEF